VTCGSQYEVHLSTVQTHGKMSSGHMAEEGDTAVELEIQLASKLVGEMTSSWKVMCHRCDMDQSDAAMWQPPNDQEGSMFNLEKG